MKKVLLRYYDAINLGDDLFVKILSDRYLNKISLISTNKHLSKINTIHYYHRGIYLKLAQKIFNDPFIALNRLISKNDLLIYIGGSIFTDENNAKKWLKELRFFKRLTKPYYILGANLETGIGTQVNKHIREIIAAAKDVCFRDQKSYLEARTFGHVRSARDVGFTLSAAPYCRRTTKNVVISIINTRDRFGNNISMNYDKTMADLTVRFVNSGYSVTYMSFCKYEGDELAIKRIKSKLPDKYRSTVNNYNYSGNIDEALRLLGNNEIIIGSRFHATILGLLFKKKVLPVIYSEKTKNILSDMKFDGPAIDIQDLDSFNVDTFDPKKLKPFNVDNQIKLAEKQFQELDKILVSRGNNE